MSKSLVSKLVAIQSQLKAPKGQMNKFGGYAYRSCEDILEAVKPLLAEQGVILTISDEVVVKGEGEKARFYVEATVEITDGESSIKRTAYARESENKKGMDDSQITGSTSSYARKYALNGLFLIDDTKDADATNDHGKSKPKEEAKSPVKKATKKSGNSFRKSVKKEVASEDEEL